MLAIVLKKKNLSYITPETNTNECFQYKNTTKMEEHIYLNNQRLEIKSLTFVSSLLTPMRPLLGLLITLVVL